MFLDSKKRRGRSKSEVRQRTDALLNHGYLDIYDNVLVGNHKAGNKGTSDDEDTYPVVALSIFVHESKMAQYNDCSPGSLNVWFNGGFLRTTSC